MEIEEARVIEDYVMYIAKRESRKFFGSFPTATGTIDEITRSHWWSREEQWPVPKHWGVTLTHKTRWHEFITAITFNFPTIHIQVLVSLSIADKKAWTCSWSSGGNIEEGGITVNIADPNSKREMEQFFAETYKCVRKEMRARRYLVRAEAILKDLIRAEAILKERESTS